MILNDNTLISLKIETLTVNQIHNLDMNRQIASCSLFEYENSLYLAINFLGESEIFIFTAKNLEKPAVKLNMKSYLISNLSEIWKIVYFQLKESFYLALGLSDGYLINLEFFPKLLTQATAENPDQYSGLICKFNSQQKLGSIVEDIQPSKDKVMISTENGKSYILEK